MKSLKRFLKWYFTHCSVTYDFTPTEPFKKD